MTTEEARKYFDDFGLSYRDIHPVDFQQLHAIVSLHLNLYRKSTDHASQMNMRVAEMRVRDKKFSNGLVRGKIKIDGSYFKRREGITFNENGFIGFCAEFSNENTQPILNAFVEWCDFIRLKRKGEKDSGSISKQV